ncbi:Cytidylate kinase [Ectothiorhodospira mobilis]|uniref:Cytidylate kinase n=1 Tax=Ectothiorhodospira mobilis TaxID=195064 RepID=A0A1I4QZ55_ECTMO|nr:cytidylate kinase-like family protein [Ectothiorhodospira mobilis]SFM45319.1 Cytidylate kinase [Ectothiorhodospira mobilis]
MHDVNDLIQRYIRTEIRGRQGGGSPAKPLVTLSRDYGAGGEEVARILARRLGVSSFDETILDRVAKHAEQDRALLAELDEKVSAWKTHWIYSVLSGDVYHLTAYRRALVDVLLALSAEGGVIVGRGAHVFLRDRGAFRVRIAGSPRYCAPRVAAAEGLAEAEAREKVETINHQRQQFLWDLVRRRTNDATQFDLTINTDRLHDWERVARLILQAMADAGVPLPHGALHGEGRA